MRMKGKGGVSRKYVKIILTEHMQHYKYEMLNSVLRYCYNYNLSILARTELMMTFLLL